MTLNLVEQAYKWTDEADEVLVLRYSNLEGKSHGEFQHPMTVGESVSVSDWNPTEKCGGGIHGWAWGIAVGDGKEPVYDATQAVWQVYGVRPEDLVGNIDGDKCKFKTGLLRCVGTWQKAFEFILRGQIKLVQHCSEGASSSTGYNSASSSTGDSSASSSTGYRSASSSTGDSSASSSTGECSAAVVTGLGGKVQAGERGLIALAWWNPKAQKAEMRAALIGKGKRKLKPLVWYTLDEHGHFVEVAA